MSTPADGKARDTLEVGRQDLLSLPDSSERMVINLGPSHPAMHGTVRMLVELEGETIAKAVPEIGFLHRGFEKSCEASTWTQCLPYVDRLNYVSSLLNDFGYLVVVEKLLRLEIPERAKFIRVIAGELHRICDHLTLVGALGMELGGFTAFLYALEARELIWDRIAELTGARVTTSFGRPGGVQRDLPQGWGEKVLETLDRVAELRDELDVLLTRNRIFADRTRGAGVISRDDALEFGFTGPCLRACGVGYDVRKAHPYFVYDQLDFDVPLGEHGDNYDRYLVRMEEMKQSDRIVRQALAKIPEGPVMVGDWRVALPPKEQVYGTIEGTIAHFKLIMEGIQVPAGEAYAYTEAANGELGFYAVSDGSGRPYKLHVRAPGFPILSAVPSMIEGRLLADLIPTFDSINMIGGEVEV
ncbi:MAG TPA: NADH-quinone oxidoreductase subunit D [Myxococcales bacterium]|jgi:NADH-quinone oxidoreductase subunit D|nr:NADH-quinone oxidoreductase subunit D [Myxococcales bacterium]